MKVSINRIILVLLVLCILDIFLVNIFTIKLLPGKGMSGNGNLGVIFLIVFLPLYVGLIVSIYVKYLKTLNRRQLYIYLILGSIGAVTASFLLLRFVVSQYKHFGDKLEGFGVLNQYTNTIFVNYYSFTLSISIVIISIAVINLIRLNRKNN